MSGRRAAARVYLHGFASGPGSTKARIFAERFAARGIGLEVPDLNEGEGGFEALTISRMIAATGRAMERARKAAGLDRDAPAVLIGSSLGGYVAALVAARDATVAAAVLMAPAFDFARRLLAGTLPEQRAAAEAQGFLEVFHFALGRPARIGRSIYTDGLAYEAFPDVRVPALVLHGVRDESVPIALSREFAAGRPNVRLLELEDDHQLLASTGRIIEETEAFLGRLWF